MDAPMMFTRRFRRRLRRLGVLVAGLMVTLVSQATAQTATVPALKAAFLYNFAGFAEWPADVLPAGQPLTICVAGDDAVFSALDQTFKGRSLQGREVRVLSIKLDGPIRSCHVLYLSGFETKRCVQLFESLKGLAILTVGDGDQFAGSGGIAQLFTENNKMRFAINIASAQRARVQLSSRLLALAKIVKDDPDGQR
jgi:hypothetical protein